MRDAFDKDHPLKEELDIAHEPIPQAVLEPVHVARDQIVSFIALRNSRNGKVLEYKVRGRKEAKRTLLS